MKLKNHMVCERDEKGLLICVTKGVDSSTASVMCRKSDAAIVEIHNPTESFYRKGIITTEKDKDANWRRMWKVVPCQV